MQPSQAQNGMTRVVENIVNAVRAQMEQGRDPANVSPIDFDRDAAEQIRRMRAGEIASEYREPAIDPAAIGRAVRGVDEWLTSGAQRAPLDVPLVDDAMMDSVPPGPLPMPAALSGGMPIPPGPRPQPPAVLPATAGAMPVSPGVRPQPPGIVSQQPGSPGAPTQPGPMLPTPKGFLDDPQTYDTLLRFGLNLMEASQPKPGTIVGPSLIGALGEAGNKTLATRDVQKKEKQALDAAAAKVKREERRHQENLALTRRKLELDGIRNAQDAETKRLLIQIRQDNATLDRRLKEMNLRAETLERVSQVRNEYQELINEASLDTSLSDEQIQQNVANLRAEMSRVVDQLLAQSSPSRGGAPAGGAQTQAPVGLPTKVVNGKTVPDGASLVVGQTYNLPGGRTGTWNGTKFTTVQ